MSLKPRTTMVAVIAVMLYNAPLWANESQGYVVDQIFITMRSGQGNQFRIIASGIPSNTPLEILEKSEDSSWSKVRYKDKEGWILSQYISLNPTATIQLASATAQLKELRSSNHTLSRELSKLKTEYRTSNKDLQDLKKQQNQLTEKYNHIQTLSANPIKINALNKELNVKMEGQAVEIALLNGEANRLRNDQRNGGMAIGAGAVLSGLLIGWINGRRNKRANRGWA